jgi:type IV pilus assembly protein PilA
MEMLVVVAIIAVLVAIAIPIFSAQLNRARVEKDAAAIRSGYAAASLRLVDGDVYMGTVPRYQCILLLKDTSVWSLGDGTIPYMSDLYSTTGDTSKDGIGPQDIAGQQFSWTPGQVVVYLYDDTYSKLTLSHALR